MADRYLRQFTKTYQVGMVGIQGYIGVGTGGSVNAATASGTTWGPFLNQASGSIPTGWQNNITVSSGPANLGGYGFSGVQGLYGAGVNGVARIATGIYNIQLSDSFYKCDSVQVSQFVASGVATLDTAVIGNTVGYGNTAAGNNIITIQFTSSITGVGVDIANGGGFYVDIQLRNASAQGVGQ